MDATETRCFCARMSALPQLLESIRGIGRDAGLERSLLLRVELVLEELFTNTVRHGYGGDCDSPIWLHALYAAGSLCITYQDAATPFDPLQHRANLDQPIDRR